jgi:MFS family permease
VGIAVLCVSQFVDVLSVNAAVIALPDIRADLGLGATAAQWVISVYALLFGSLLLFAGRLADRVGHRRLFVIGLCAFAAGSALCAAAPSGAVLVAARAATGAAAALSVPPALALLVAGTEAARRRRALGWWTAAGAGGGIAGLTLGGVLTDLAGWRSAFVVPAVLAAACLPFVGTLAATRRPDDRPLDIPGAVTAVGGLALLLAGVSGIGRGSPSPAALAALAGAGLLLAAFAAIEARARWPLVPRGVISDHRLVAGTLASAVNTAATTPFAVLGALYLQDVRGWSPTENGLSFVPFSAAVIAGSAIGAVLLGRLGPRRTLLVAGVPLVAMPLASCVISPDGGALVLVGARAVDGLGLGCAAVTATALGTASARDGAGGFAAGLINTATQLGTALSVALLLPLAAAVAGDAPTPANTVTGIRVGFAATAGIALAGTTAVAAILRRRP